MARKFGIAFKIPKGAYQKALAKVQKDRRLWRGKTSRPATAKSHATNRDRSVVEVYRLQTRKKAAPITGYVRGGKITNFTGLRICTIVKRTGVKGITARCVDGHTYVGRSNGEGMWINLRPKKG